MYGHFFCAPRTVCRFCWRYTSKCRYSNGKKFNWFEGRNHPANSVRWSTNLAEQVDKLSDYACVIKPFEKTEDGSFELRDDTEIPKPSSDQINEIVSKFRDNVLVAELAYEQGMSKKVFSICLNKFKQYLNDSTTLPFDVNSTLNDIASGTRSCDDIFPYFLQHCKNVYPALACYPDLQKISNLTNPANWYPKAREMKRTFVYHAGPTNSGKTYGATKSFFEAERALYAAPLRLLATEIYLKCKDLKVPCDLITGEDQRFVNEDKSSCGHTACTVEMADLNQVYDTVVIDEIQFLRDEQRGYAWTRALLGIPSKEVHLCGEPAAVNLARKLVESCGDSFEVRNYERLTPLCYDDRAIQSWSEIEKGDCIIAFSKSTIFSITSELDVLGIKYAVIYGALPPRTKIEQARVFNDANSGVDVLVASDAIGMGLNLSIRRIIFYSMNKFSRNDNGVLKIVKVPQYLALQIAGRAGRYGSAYEFGHVSAFGQKALDEFREIAQQPIVEVEKAGISPTFDQLEMFSYHLPEYGLKNLVDIFNLIAQVDSNFFVCPSFEFKQIANLLEDVDMPNQSKFKFCIAPANVARSPFMASMMLKYAQRFSEGKPLRAATLKNWIKWPLDVPKTRQALENLESVNESLELYLWLSFRFPVIFDDAESVNQLMNETAVLIERGLENLKLCKVLTPGQIVESKNKNDEMFSIAQKTHKRKNTSKIQSSLKALQASRGRTGNSVGEPLVNTLKHFLPPSEVGINEKVKHDELNNSSIYPDEVNEMHTHKNDLVQVVNGTDTKVQDFSAEDFRRFYETDLKASFNARIIGHLTRKLGRSTQSLMYYCQQCTSKHNSLPLTKKVDSIIDRDCNVIEKSFTHPVSVKYAISLWLQNEILLWLYCKYPSVINYRKEELEAKQKQLFDRIMPYVGASFLDQYSLTGPEVSVSVNTTTPRLLISSFKMCASRFNLFFSSVSDETEIDCGFLETYLKKKLWSFIKHPSPNQECIKSSINDTVEYFGIMNKYFARLFPDCDPVHLKSMEDRLHDFVLNHPDTENSETSVYRRRRSARLSLSNHRHKAAAAAIGILKCNSEFQSTASINQTSTSDEAAKNETMTVHLEDHRIGQDIRESANDSHESSLPQTHNAGVLTKLLNTNRITQHEYEEIIKELQSK